MLKPNQIIDRKKLLRKFFLKLRQEKNQDNRDISALIMQKIVKLFDSLEHNMEDIIIGFYLPLSGEIDLTNLNIKVNAKLALPKIKEKEIYFVKYQQGDKLEKTNLGNLVHPVGDDLVSPDILLIPALSMDLAGYRLGYGSGFYDRYLAHTPKSKVFGSDKLTIGICQHDYLVEFLPRQVHDIRLKYVITEKIIIKLC